MNALRYLRHGPLVFWMVAALALSSLTYSSFQVGKSSPRASVITADAAWDQVVGWRASLAQLPLAAAGGEVASLGRALAATAQQYSIAASDAGNVALAAAWENARTAAADLAETPTDDPGQLQASVRRVGLAGDQLLATVSGVGWATAELPMQIPITGTDDSLIDGVPGPTG